MLMAARDDSDTVGRPYCNSNLIGREGHTSERADDDHSDTLAVGCRKFHAVSA